MVHTAVSSQMRGMSRFALILLVIALGASCAEKVVVRPEIAAIVGYAYGDSTAALETVHGLVQAAYGDPAAALQIEKELTEVLKMPEATDDARDFVCRQLWMIGSDYSVPVLAGMLTGEKRMSDMARYALQEQPGAAARAALEQALKTADGDNLIGIINSLGERGEPESAPAVVALLNRDDTIAVAAARALGKIDAPDSRLALETSAAVGSPAVKAAAEKALLMHGR